MPANQLPKWAAPRVLHSLAGNGHGPEMPRVLVHNKIQVIGCDIAWATPGKV